MSKNQRHQILIKKDNLNASTTLELLETKDEGVLLGDYLQDIELLKARLYSEVEIRDAQINLLQKRINTLEEVLYEFIGDLQEGLGGVLE